MTSIEKKCYPIEKNILPIGYRRHIYILAKGDHACIKEMAMAYKWLESLKRLREDQIARQNAKRLELRFDGFCAHLFAMPPARSPFKAPSLAQCRGSSMRNIIPASDWIDYADGREG